tara:strand:- start:9477 stop:10478 length:1002 start_codon:yes stop_codon:yes gene_type:complete
MKWGLIGASTIASQFMINAIRSVDAGTVKWVMSGSQEHGERYAQDHAIDNATTELDQMLQDPQLDAVYISSTNEKHCAQAMSAIKAGKHVLCEKPLAITLDQAVTMVRAAKQAGVVFATNHHLRNAGTHLAIRDLVRSGRIGNLLSMRIFHAVSLPENLRGWRINNVQAGGGVIPDIIVHNADTARFHLDEDPAAVVAISGTSGLGDGVEDSVMTAWTMPSGVMVLAHASFTHQFAETGLEIYGTTGSIRAKGIMTQRPIGSISLTDAEGSHPVSYSDHELYTRAVRLFGEAVTGGGRPGADGVDGIKSLAVALAVREAANSGAKVSVDYGGY